MEGLGCSHIGWTPERGINKVMIITLNGEQTKLANIQKCSVSELIERLDLGKQPVLVELNGTALYEREFSESEIVDGSEIEIVKMVAGG